MSKPSRRKIRARTAAPISPPMEAGVPDVPVYEPSLDWDTFRALRDRVAELEGDLVRVVELIVMGDIDSAKFKEILAKRQGGSDGR